MKTLWTELLLICKLYSKMKGSLFEMGISGVTLGTDTWHPFFVAETQDVLVFARNSRDLPTSLCKQLEAQHPLFISRTPMSFGVMGVKVTRSPRRGVRKPWFQ